MAEENHSLHKGLLWGAGISTALGLSPYLLPHIGVGTSVIRDKVISLCGNSSTYGRTDIFPGYGSGLSGFINQGLAKVPVIGESLASGGWTTAITAGVVGIGGTMLGNYVTKHYDKKGGIPWGKIIKYAAIATSFLVALPGLLSGISMGITFLAMTLADTGMASSVIDGLKNSLGFMGPVAMKAAGSSIGGFVSQAVCCGVAALPALGSAFVPSPSSNSSHHSTTTKTWVNKLSTAPAIPSEMIR